MSAPATLARFAVETGVSVRTNSVRTLRRIASVRAICSPE
jgi:hypothetical protein